MTSSAPARPRLLHITWPILAEQLLHMLVGLLGVWLVSHISDDAAGAYAMANQITLAFLITFRFISLGASVVVTQYLGAADRQGAERIARAAIAANAWLGVISFVTVALGATSLLRLMNLPPELLPVARPYLLAIGVILLFDAINFSLGAVLRAHTHTRQTLQLIVLMYAVQLGLSFPLMFGWGPLPACGMLGLAAAAIVARIASLAMHLRLWWRLLGIRPTLREFWQIRVASVREILHIGLPGAGETVAYRISFMLILALVAGMGPAALSTHAYTMQIIPFVLLLGLSLGFGTEIIVGHRIGAGQFRSADRQVRRGLRVGLVVSTSLSVLVAMLGKPLLGLFTHDASIIATGAQLLWLTVLIEPGRTFNLVVINGLRAAGDARFPVAFGVVSMFAVAVGLAWLLGVHFGMGLAGVWLAYAADEWVRGLAMWLRWQRLGWLPHARRTRRRLRSQAASAPG